MKYKVLPHTELFLKLNELFERCLYANEAADKLAKSIGASDHATLGRNRAGGIDAFQFARGKEPDKELWMQPDRHKNPDLFYPRNGKKYTANKELHEKIAALPTVSFDQYNAVIGFEKQWKGFTQIRTYRLQRHEAFFLIDTTDEADYTPVEGMQEITVSEYKSLEEQIKP